MLVQAITYRGGTDPESSDAANEFVGNGPVPRLCRTYITAAPKTDYLRFPVLFEKHRKLPTRLPSVKEAYNWLKSAGKG